MRYTVIWTPNAEGMLAELWLNSAHRQAVTAASHAIDQQLRIDPDQQGESRDQGRRILLETPLGVLFRVLPADRIVYVLTVWETQ